MAVVTHYDEIYEEDDSKCKVKSRAKREIMSATGVDVSDCSIILLSGKWALEARLLSCSPDKYQKLYKQLLLTYEGPAGQNEELTTQVVSSKFEELSGIHLLEDRYVQ